VLDRQGFQSAHVITQTIGGGSGLALCGVDHDRLEALKPVRRVRCRCRVNPDPLVPGGSVQDPHHISDLVVVAAADMLSTANRVRPTTWVTTSSLGSAAKDAGIAVAIRDQ